MPPAFIGIDAQSLEVAPGDSVTLEHHLDFRPQWQQEQQMARWPAGRYFDPHRRSQTVRASEHHSAGP